MEGDEFYRRPELLVRVVHGQRKKKGAVRKKKRGACPAGAGKNGDGGPFPSAGLIRSSLMPLISSAAACSSRALNPRRPALVQGRSGRRRAQRAAEFGWRRRHAATGSRSGG